MAPNPARMPGKGHERLDRAGISIFIKRIESMSAIFLSKTVCFRIFGQSNPC
jgi:hypothetical protein